MLLAKKKKKKSIGWKIKEWQLDHFNH